MSPAPTSVTVAVCPSPGLAAKTDATVAISTANTADANATPNLLLAMRAPLLSVCKGEAPPTPLANPTAVRQPCYLLERSLGFASPPRDGFAFIAAPERQVVRKMVPTRRLADHLSHGHLSLASRTSPYAGGLLPDANF